MDNRYEIINNWKIDKLSESFLKHNKRHYSAECTMCESTHIVSYADVKANKSKMCKSCSTSKRFFKHGESPSSNKKSTILYSRWLNMIDRCYNKNNSHYASYGARGVTVCDNWKLNFISFRDWAINNGFSQELQIDKDILSAKLGIIPSVYSPDTCMFVTSAENNKHRIFDPLSKQISNLKATITKRQFSDEQLDKAVKMLSVGMSFADTKLVSNIKCDATLSNIKSGKIKSLIEIAEEINQLQFQLYNSIKI